MTNSGKITALACNLSALGPEQRQAHQATTAALFRTALAVDELPNGLVLRFSNESATLLQAAAFIANEQLCCPFLDFDLRIEPQKERLQLSLTGGTHVRDFLRAEFADLLEVRDP